MVNWYVKVSEWLLFNAKWAIFQLYHGKNILDQHDQLDFSLKQQSAGAHVIPIGHVQNSFNFFFYLHFLLQILIGFYSLDSLWNFLHTFLALKMWPSSNDFRDKISVVQFVCCLLSLPYNVWRLIIFAPFLIIIIILSFRAPWTCPRQISGTTEQNFMKLGGVIDICF